MVAIVGGLIFKFKKLELENRTRSEIGNQDISAELKNAIKEEFSRLRQENEELKSRLTSLEQNKIASSVQLDAAQLAEIAKQVALQQRS